MNVAFELTESAQFVIMVVQLLLHAMQYILGFQHKYVGTGLALDAQHIRPWYALSLQRKADHVSPVKRAVVEESIITSRVSRSCC